MGRWYQRTAGVLSMAHLKHCGPIRQAAHAKRTALIEIYSDEAAANDESGDLSEADLLAIDRAYEAAKDERCADFGQREADRATALEIARDPMGGFAS